MSNIEIKGIAAGEFFDEHWKEYYRGRKDFSKRSNQAFLFESWEQLKEMTVAWLKQGYGIFVIFRGDCCIGYFSLEVRMPENPEKRFIYFRNGFLSSNDAELHYAIYRAFLDFDLDSNRFILKSEDGQFDNVEQNLNAELTDFREKYALDFKRAKEEVILTWIEKYPKKLAHLSIKHYEAIPDHLLADFCSLFSSLLRDIPATTRTLELDMDPEEMKAKEINDEKNGQVSYRYLVFDQNKLVGMTNVYLNRNRPETMRQYMTGTAKDYRKMGIAKWMKAAMFLKLKEDFPSLETIKTEVHPNNIGSKTVSVQMGYEKTGFEKEWLIKRNQIESFLESLNS